MLEFVSLRPLGWLAVVAVLAIAVRYSLADRPRLLHWASAGLSASAVVCLALALCRPYLATQCSELHVNFLVDVSQSVDLKRASESLSTVDAWIKGLRSGDSWSLFAVGRGVRQFDSTDDLRKVLEQWQTGVGDDEFRSATRLAKGLLATRLAFPSGKVRQAVLLTDGQETDDDIEAVLRQVAEEGVEVRRWPLAGLSYPEAAVVSVTPSSRDAFQGEIVHLSVLIASNRAMPATVRLIHKGVAVQSRQAQLKPGDKNRVEFDAEMATSGESPWTVEILPAEDHFPVNNQASCTISVRGRPSILVLHQKPKEMRPIVRALREQDMNVEVRSEHGLPDSLEGLSAFDAIVLADFPATAMSPRQMQMIKQYVVDLGGGLIMLGSENSFGLGGYYKTPVEDVLPLISRFEKEKEKPSLALVLVIDKSGSMTGTPIELARQAAKATVELLGVHDTIGVIGFDEQTQVICEMTNAASKDAVQASIDSLQAGGGTYMYPAMVAARDMLEATPAKIRHMICLTDGQTQPADHESLVEDMASAGITVSTVAIADADRQLLARIAELGHGRFYETNDPANVPQIFTKETMQASRSAIKEDMFTCVRIGDHPMLAGFDKNNLPLSLGYVMTEAKPTAQLLLAVETGDPLLAVGRYGLGAGMAYTSDLTERWGGEWLAWENCGKFWSQAFRAVLRKNSVDGLRVETRRVSDGWELDIHRHGDDGLPVNGIRWNASLLDEQGQAEKIAVQEIGLGRYRAKIVSADKPRLTLRLRDEDHDKTKTLHFQRSYPVEYQLTQDLPAAVAALPQADAKTLVGEVAPLQGRYSIVHYFYFAAILCMLGSILLRRV
jgi:Ca-activated chloride channel homolog